MRWIRGKLADQVEDHAVLYPEGAVSMTTPGTESVSPTPSIVERLWSVASVSESELQAMIQRRLSDVLHVHQSHQKRYQTFSRSRRVTRKRQVIRQFSSNGTDQCQNGSSNLLAPYLEQPRSARFVVADPRPAFSETKRMNRAPTSFDQQPQLSQGHTP